jgi:hypothetical protein
MFRRHHGLSVESADDFEILHRTRPPAAFASRWRFLARLFCASEAPVRIRRS